MNLPNRSALRSRWKALLVTLVIGVTSFTIGSYANPVIVEQVSSIGGNHVNVPAPEVHVLDTVWDLDLNNSVVSSLTLTLTTTGGSAATGSKLYLVDVQVSCLLGTVVTPNCSR